MAASSPAPASWRPRARGPPRRPTCCRHCECGLTMWTPVLTAVRGVRRMRKDIRSFPQDLPPVLGDDPDDSLPLLLDDPDDVPEWCRGGARACGWCRGRAGPCVVPLTETLAGALAQARGPPAYPLAPLRWLRPLAFCAEEELEPLTHGSEWRHPYFWDTPSLQVEPPPLCQSMWDSYMAYMGETTYEARVAALGPPPRLLWDGPCAVTRAPPPALPEPPPPSFSDTHPVLYRVLNLALVVALALLTATGGGDGAGYVALPATPRTALEQRVQAINLALAARLPLAPEWVGRDPDASDACDPPPPPPPPKLRLRRVKPAPQSECSCLEGERCDCRGVEVGRSGQPEPVEYAPQRCAWTPSPCGPPPRLRAPRRAMTRPRAPQ